MLSLPWDKRIAFEARLKWLEKARPKQIPPPDLEWFAFLALAGRGFGKALSLDMQIPTLTGWTTMRDIKVGDVLFDERGIPCHVTFRTDIMYDRKCYEVEFDDGTVIVADADHQWFTWTHKARKAEVRRITGENTRADRPQCMRRPGCEPQVRTTEEIKATLLHAGREKNHSIDTCQPIVTLQGPEKLPIEPYLFGVWLGDGHSKMSALTCADEELILELRRRGHYVSEGKLDKRGNNKSLLYSLGHRNHSRKDSFQAIAKRLGVYGNKHIPMVYLRANEKQRLSLLMGLMDTDGSVTPGGHCEFTSTMERLAMDTYELIASLGFKSSMISDRAKLNGKDCGQRFRITFTPHRPVFHLKRKLERQHFGKRQAKKISRRYIVSVRETESVPVRCIQVDSPSSLFLCSRAFIPTHNTKLCAEDSWWYAAWNDGVRVAAIAPTNSDLRKTVMEGESGLLASVPPQLLEGGPDKAYNKTTNELKFVNGSVIQGFSSESYERLRGPQFHRAWLEELAAFPRLQETWDMLMFCLRLGQRPQAVISTTPKPFKLIKELKARADVYKVSGSTYENKANLAPTFLEVIEKQYAGTRIGRQEIMGEILDDVMGALWTWSMIENAHYVGVCPEFSYVTVNLDPSVGDGNPDNDECGITGTGLGRDGFGYVLADRSMRGSPNEWVQTAVKLYVDLNASWIVAEANNGGRLIEDSIHAANPNIPVKLVHASQGKRTRAEPVAMLYEQGRIRHFGVFPDLEAQMCDWSPELSKYSPGRMDSLVWGLTALMVEAPSDFFCFVA